MKKSILFVFVLVLAFSVRSFAQCTPNPAQNDFMVPDSVTDFAPAFTYMAYDDVLYFSVPTDTLVFGMPASIDSVTFVGIDGLPASISYSPFPANGVMLGGTKGCVALTGTPTSAEIGTYNLTINTIIAGTLGILGDTMLAVPIPGYSLKVLDSSSYGIYHYEPHFQFSVFQNSPNPFIGKTEIAFTSPGKENIKVEVFDLLGKCVFEMQMISSQGFNSVIFDATGLKAGVYVYKVTNGELVFSQKMSLQGK